MRSQIKKPAVVPLFFILIINHDAVDFPRNRRAGVYGKNALGTVGQKVGIVVKFAALSFVFRMTEGAVPMSADNILPVSVMPAWAAAISRLQKIQKIKLNKNRKKRLYLICEI